MYLKNLYVYGNNFNRFTWFNIVHYSSFFIDLLFSPSNFLFFVYQLM